MVNIIDGFKKKCERLLSVVDYKDSKFLYHFTSIKNFELIIKSRQLLFTDYRNLNDAIEIDYGRNLVGTMLSPSREFNGNFVEKLITFIKNDNIIPYVCSLSTNINNLSLWRFYADDGLGVAIGFDPKFIREDETKKEDDPLVAKVIYGDNEIKSIVSKLLNRIAKITKSYPFSSQPQEAQQEIINSLNITFANYLNVLFLVTKHPGYKVEEEVRLILTEGKLSRLSTHPKGFYFNSNRKKEFESSSKKILITDELEIKETIENRTKKAVLSSKLKKDCFKEIWIGPRCPEDFKRKIAGMLEKYSFNPQNIKIEYFTSHYRG